MKTDLQEQLSNGSSFCSKPAALLIGFLAGAITGFLIAPLKNGMRIFSNNCYDSCNVTSENEGSK